jgi:hypothetical protein
MIVFALAKMSPWLIGWNRLLEQDLPGVVYR